MGRRRLAETLSKFGSRLAGSLSMTTPRRILGSNDLLAIELTAALKQSDVEQLSRLLADEPDLASCVVRSEKGGGRTPLHLFADWPGRIANAAAIEGAWIVTVLFSVDPPTRLVA